MRPLRHRHHAPAVYNTAGGVDVDLNDALISIKDTIKNFVNVRMGSLVVLAQAGFGIYDNSLAYGTRVHAGRRDGMERRRGVSPCCRVLRRALHT